MQPPDEAKKAIREAALARRDAIPLPVRKIKDSLIRDRLLALGAFREAAKVLLYASFRSEVDTMGILREAVAMGKEVYLPKSAPEARTFTIHRVRGPEDLAPGYMGIPEPSTGAGDGPGVQVEGMDIVIMPGVAFDLGGARLGYGGGFYDRMLQGVGTIKVALAYEEQISEGEIPRQDHDVAVDFVLTDKRTIGGDSSYG